MKMLRTLFEHLGQLQHSNAHNAIFSGEAIVLGLEHQLIVLRFTLVSDEAEIGSKLKKP